MLLDESFDINTSVFSN